MKRISRAFFSASACPRWYPLAAPERGAAEAADAKRRCRRCKPEARRRQTGQELPTSQGLQRRCR